MVKSCFTKVCHFSTHSIVRVAISMSRYGPPPTVILSRSFKRTDFTMLNFDLAHADWSVVFTAPGVTAEWEHFLTIFLPILDSYAPVRSIKIRNPNAPTVSDDTKGLMCRRRGALAHYGRGSTEYRDANRAVRSAIRRDSRADVERRIRESGRQGMWRIIRPYVGGKRGSRVTPGVSAVLCWCRS